VQVAGAVGVPLALLWDFSWESTIGVDLIWSPPHLAMMGSVVIAALGAAAQLNWHPRSGEVPLGPVAAPLGAWITLWGAIAFLTATLFDQWWQASYGLAAGLWPPPQLLKAAGFLAVTSGAWLTGDARSRFPWGASAVLALISVMTIPLLYANRQHSAAFFLAACGTYPLVLVAVAKSGSGRWPATRAALGYTLLLGTMVWLLPLFPGVPLVGPIYHPRDHFLPPPFPLLLLLPAFGLDWLLRQRPAREAARSGSSAAGEAGLAFFLIFTVAHWVFASFLLSPAADHWFFAGGGRHWPFFLQIVPGAETSFWPESDSDFTGLRALLAIALAIGCSWLGLQLGRGLSVLKR